MFKPILFCILLIVTSSVLFAQDDPDFFPIIENCIPEPTLPPDEWTYDGTILMSGYAGVHGMNAEWETPHVLVLNSRSSKGYEPLPGGALSPDSQWYALPMGETWVEISYNQYAWVHGVRVYKTDGSQDFLEFENRYDFYVYSAGAWSYLPIQWVNNESLIMGLIHLFPFENRAEPALFEIHSYLASVSPDLSIVYSGYNDSQGLLYVDDDSFVNHQLGNIAWKHDSSGFIGIAKNNNQTVVNYYTRDAELARSIISIDEGEINIKRGVDAHNERRWSSNNTRFVFRWIPPYEKRSSEHNRIYLIDFVNEQVIDTCLDSVNNPIWSPDDKKLAYLERSTSNLNIVVIDLETWQAYIVGKHIGTDSDMLGWRD